MKVLIAMIAFFGISLGMMAQPQHRQGPEKGRSGMAALDLSDEQKTEIKAIHLAQMKETTPLRDDIKINKARIDAEVKKDNPDMKSIVSLVEANAKLMTDIQVKSIESRIKVRSLLTDDQKVLYDAHAQKARKKKFIAQHRRAEGQRRGAPARQKH